MSDIEFDVDGHPFADAGAAATAPAPAPGNGAGAVLNEDIMSVIERHQRDDAFMQKYLDGSAAEVEIMRGLYARAFDGPAAPAEDPAAEANAPLIADAAQSAFAPSVGPWEFDGLLHPDQSEAETREGMEIAQALHDSGIPVSVAESLRAIGQRIAQDGGPGEPEAALAAAKAELEHRHGQQAGAQMIEFAWEAVEHLAATDSRLGDGLKAAGLWCDADGIETLARWWRVGTQEGKQ